MSDMCTDNHMISFSSFDRLQRTKELWEKFGTIPIDPETEETEEDWNEFPAGTFREDIWHWFEETFHVNVAEDLMNL